MKEIKRRRFFGLLGLGAIGRSMVPKARGFGMRVIACDPYVDKAASIADVKLVELETLLV